MRHRKQRTRLGRQKSHRVATLKSLARSMVLHEKIKTTHTKAKETQKFVEKLITTAKTDSIDARRRAFAILGSRDLVSKLFKEVIPLFKNRASGYTRIIPFNFRKGDGASMVFLELTEKKPEVKPKPLKKAKKSVATDKAPKKEKTEAAPKVESKIQEEKVVEQVKKEKAKQETKRFEKKKGFLKKVKGLFRRRTNM